MLSAVAPGLGVLILGNSVFEGVGTAFLIPPVYILTTMAFTSLESRAQGVRRDQRDRRDRRRGRAADRGADHLGDQLACRVRVPGPGRRHDRPAQPPRRRSGGARPQAPVRRDGAVLSAAGMFFVVFGIIQAGHNNTLLVVFLVIGVAFLAGFFVYIRARERRGKEPLLSLACSATARPTSA